MIKLVQLGRSGKTFGSGGAIKIHVEKRFKEDLEKCDFLFFELLGSKVPFLITDRQASGEIISLEGINSPEEASRLVNSPIFLEEQKVSDLRTTDSINNYNQLLGYQLVDQNAQKEVGVIEKIEEYPQQIMLFIQKESSTFLVPLNESFLINLDHEEKKLFMNLPEGLI